MESSIMREICNIQEKFYEETKDMTLKEFLEYIHKRAEKVVREIKGVSKGEKQDGTIRYC